jgi:DNA-binding NarL/FixJ family response regulator
VTSNRIRVLIAGNVYVKRALVRRFLEDDGYEVVGDVVTAEGVLPAVRAGRPDAIVLDEDLAKGGVPIAAIRESAPDARLVVFTAVTPGAGAPPPGADGYLDKGVGLSALTALLGRLFAGSATPLAALAEGGAGAAIAAAADTTEGTMDDTQPIQPAGTAPKGGGSRAALARYVAIAAGLLLIVWGVVSAIQTEDSGGATETVAEATPTADTGPDVVVEEEQPTPLDEAYASLDDMIAALEEGNYVYATVEAQSLMSLREEALAAGFATTGFDAEVTARLESLVPKLPLRVNTQLAEILGSLYPPFQAEPEPADETQVLGETVVNDGGGSSTDGDQTGDDTGDNGGNNGGDGNEEPAPQPGDGKVWGLSHKPPDGGWHGHKPPKPPK